MTATVQELSSMRRIPVFLYRVHESTPQLHILSQMSPISTVVSTFILMLFVGRLGC
jgi:hypothetical protein